MRMSIEPNAEHIEDFAFVPVGVYPKGRDARGSRVIALEGYLKTDKIVSFKGEEVVYDGEFMNRVTVFAISATLVNRGDVV